MSRRITTIDAAASVSLPPEAVDALGVEVGGELDVEIYPELTEDHIRACLAYAADRERRLVTATT